MLRQRTFAGSRTVRRRRPWAMVSWWFSLLFVVPVALLAGNAIRSSFFAASPTITLKVTDGFTDQGLAGVEVIAGDQRLVSNDDGKVELQRPTGAVLVTIRRENYEPVYGTMDEESGGSQAIALRPTTLEGTVTDERTGAGIGDATVSAVTDAGPSPTTAMTDDQGHYLLTNVPPNARVHVDAGDYGVVEEPIGERTRIDFKLRLSVVTGVVSDVAGDPIQGAIVRMGEATDVTDEDGAYRLTNTPDTGDVVASSSGYFDGTTAVTAERTVDFTLELVQIRAVYLTGPAAGSQAEVERLIDLVDRTELNAIVVDIKENVVFYDTQVGFFRDAGNVEPAFDAAQLVQTLHDHDIYAIARLVVFKDPIVAEARPDLSVKDVNGGLWRDYNDVAWVNAFNQELWQANVDLAVEAAELGFDEIQYDYIRFPSDGDLTTAEFGNDYGEESRVGAIVGFLELSRDQIKPTGAKLAVDVFGIITLYDDDQGIGQRLRDIAPLVDYVSPMVYPSHYDASSIEVGGEPNDYPYDVVALSLELAKEKMPGMALKLRPWLQDFDLGGMTPYGAEEVRAQIDATDEAGASGWMIWNAANDYHEDAFEPDQ